MFMSCFISQIADIQSLQDVVADLKGSVQELNKIAWNRPTVGRTLPVASTCTPEKQNIMYSEGKVKRSPLLAIGNKVVDTSTLLHTSPCSESTQDNVS